MPAHHQKKKKKEKEKKKQQLWQPTALLFGSRCNSVAVVDSAVGRGSCSRNLNTKSRQII
jgi:hypothetical protein